MDFGYKRDEFDTVKFYNNGDVTARFDPSQQISIVVSEGMIFKHGSAENVEKWMQQNRDKCAAQNTTIEAIMPDLSVITMRARHLTDPMLDEINRCLQTTGRAAGLVERLTDMHVEAPRPVEDDYPDFDS